MKDILNQNVVLVLNRNWQAINVITPADAFCQMSTDLATALDVHGPDSMWPVKWEDWLTLDVREHDYAVRTVRGEIRVPTVVVLSTFAKVPMKRPRFSLRNIWDRDKGRCQYTGVELGPGEGNIDHVLPRARGGETTWTNCVLSAIKVNTRKGCKTPAEAGLKLKKVPEVPRAVPVTALLKNPHGIEDWKPFLFLDS
ncbi:MAG: 5-methylcytosine-specific restriction endonuclease McrA [Candidatus Omnitrophota bacterium]|jgi:5-methylcytosine-specific restriction endonuclease McrA